MTRQVVHCCPFIYVVLWHHYRCELWPVIRVISDETGPYQSKFHNKLKLNLADLPQHSSLMYLPPPL
jgi:hypothetical protein